MNLNIFSRHKQEKSTTNETAPAGVAVPAQLGGTALISLGEGSPQGSFGRAEEIATLPSPVEALPTNTAMPSASEASHLYPSNRATVVADPTLMRK